jgi:Domain of unknown function (DUF222)
MARSSAPGSDTPGQKPAVSGRAPATSGLAPATSGRASAASDTVPGGLGGALPVECCPLTADQMAEQAAILTELFGETPDGPDGVSAGWADVSFHDHGGPGGAGFASGSALDTLLPGPALSAALDDTLTAGLDGLPDDALAGVILAARRCESRAAAQTLAAVAELDRRRMATGDPRLVEYTDTEVALLLTLPRRTARTLIASAADLSRLPATTAALAAGRIHRAQADMISFETALLDPGLAAAVELLVIEEAPRLTTTLLRRRLRHLVLAADPQAARRRAEKAQRDARVEVQAERSGATTALAGRDLPTAAALAADQRINAAARDLRAAGVAGTLPQLRAAVFLGLLTSTDPVTFLLPPDDPAEDSADDPAEPATTQPATAGTATTQPGKAASPQPATELAQPGTTQPGTTQPGSPGRRDTGRPGPASSPGHTSGPPSGPGPDREPGSGPEPAPAPKPAPAPVPGPGLGVRGTVNLTLPLSTWIGASLSPGDIAGLGPATAETSQQLADWIAENPGSRWCLTLTDAKGRAVGHGCARRPPPPPGDIQRLAEWLARLKTGPIQAGECTHARAVPGYRIPATLDHLVKIRQQTCSNPICARPAVDSDDDHTRAHDKGGITCECGLGPACRGCHQAKQAKGWRLEQPRPGEFVWQPPHGRRYPATPDTYPT